MEICSWNNRMIYVCTHKEEPAYKLDCPYEVIHNFNSGLPETYRHLRGILQILMKHIPDEVGVFQHRRYLSVTEIPEGYDCVVPHNFCGPMQVYSQYCWCHHKEDIDLLEDIISDKDFSSYIRMNNNNECYWDNMFILRKPDFIRYCNFLFSTLNEYVDRKGDARDVCFLAERIGSFFIWKNFSKDKIYVANRIQINAY